MDKKTLWRTVPRAAAVAVLALGIWLLGSVLLPFAVGLALARAAEPAVKLLTGRFRLPRWLASGCAVAVTFLLLAFGGFFLCKILCRELWSRLKALPELAGTMTEPLANLQNRLLLAARKFPDGIGAALEQGVTEFFRSGSGLGQRLYSSS